MNGSRILVLHAVTDSMSTVLMRGQAACLRTKGFEVGILSSPGEALDETAAREDCSVYSIPIAREISPVSDLFSLYRIFRLLRRLRPAICNAGTPKAGLLVGLAAWLARVPCRVYTLRGLRLETLTGFRKILLTVTEKLACSSAHRVICISPSLRERAVSLNLVSRRKTVLIGAGSSNGVNAVRFAPTPEKRAAAQSLRIRAGIAPTQQVIGFAGRWTRDKGIPELIAAFERVRQQRPDTSLLLVGGYEAGDPIASETRESIEGGEGIYRTGFTSEIDLYYLAMNIFVLPTHREGFPNTVLEAQAAELPVVTTRATGAVDSIVDGVTGILIEPGNVEDLAAALLTLLDDSERRRKMGRAGRERVLRQFQNESVWDSLASLYSEMLAEQGMQQVEARQCAQVR